MRNSDKNKLEKEKIEIDNKNINDVYNIKKLEYNKIKDNKDKKDIEKNNKTIIDDNKNKNHLEKEEIKLDNKIVNNVDNINNEIKDNADNKIEEDKNYIIAETNIK